MTPMEIARRRDVSADDRRWVLTRLLALKAEGRTRLVLWAAGCAQDVLRLVPAVHADDCLAVIALAVESTVRYVACDNLYKAALLADAMDMGGAAADACLVAANSHEPCYAACAASSAGEAAAEADPSLEEPHIQQLALLLEGV
jgi:hypothetical protein